MAYSTVSDVQKLFANFTFSGSSPVTEADVTNVHIPKADAFIDARLRRMYPTPITAAEDLELMRLLSMNLAAGAVAEILYETSAQPNDQTNARRHRDWVERLLEDILSGALTLRTERRAVADAGAFEGYPVGGGVTEPLFRLNDER